MCVLERCESNTGSVNEVGEANQESNDDSAARLLATCERARQREREREKVITYFTIMRPTYICLNHLECKLRWTNMCTQGQKQTVY